MKQKDSSEWNKYSHTVITIATSPAPQDTRQCSTVNIMYLICICHTVVWSAPILIIYRWSANCSLQRSERGAIWHSKPYACLPSQGVMFCKCCTRQQTPLLYLHRFSALSYWNELVLISPVPGVASELSPLVFWGSVSATEKTFTNLLSTIHHFLNPDNVIQ